MNPLHFSSKCSLFSPLVCDHALLITETQRRRSYKLITKAAQSQEVYKFNLYYALYEVKFNLTSHVEIILHTYRVNKQTYKGWAVLQTSGKCLFLKTVNITSRAFSCSFPFAESPFAQNVVVTWLKSWKCLICICEIGAGIKCLNTLNYFFCSSSSVLQSASEQSSSQKSSLTVLVLKVKI